MKKVNKNYSSVNNMKKVKVNPKNISRIMWLRQHLSTKNHSEHFWNKKNTSLTQNECFNLCGLALKRTYDGSSTD